MMKTVLIVLCVAAVGLALPKKLDRELLQRASKELVGRGYQADTVDGLLDDADVILILLLDLDSVISAMIRLDEAIMEEVSRQIQDNGDVIESIGEFLERIVKSSAVQMALRNLVSAVIEGLETVEDNEAGDVRVYIPKIEAKRGTIAPTVVRRIVQIIENGNKNVESIVESITDYLIQLMYDSLMQSLFPVHVFVKRETTSNREILDGLLNGVFGTLGNILDDVDKLVDILLDTKIAVTSALESLLTDIVREISQIVDNVGDIVGCVAQFIQQILKAPVIRSALRTLISAVTDGLGQSGCSSGGLLGVLLGKRSVRETSPAHQKRLLGLGTGLLDNVLDVVNDLLENLGIKNALKSLLRVVVREVGEIVENVGDVIESVTDFLQRILDALPVEQALESVISVVFDTLGGLGGVGKRAMIA